MMDDWMINWDAVITNAFLNLFVDFMILDWIIGKAIYVDYKIVILNENIYYMKTEENPEGRESTEGVWIFQDVEDDVDPTKKIIGFWVWQHCELKPLEPYKYSRKYRRRLARVMEKALMSNVLLSIETQKVMGDLIFNLRVYRYHLQINSAWRVRIVKNTGYNFKRDPFIHLFQFGK